MNVKVRGQSSCVACLLEPHFGFSTDQRDQWSDLVVGGGVFSSLARWCTALGPAWMSERRLRVIASTVLRRGVRVSTSVVWAAWSLTRLGGGLGAGVDVGAAATDVRLRRVALRSPPPCCVEVLVSTLVVRATWSLTRVWGAVLGTASYVVLYGFRPIFLINFPTLFDFINQRHCRDSKKDS